MKRRVIAPVLWLAGLPAAMGVAGEASTQRILFQSFAPGGGGLYTMNRSGSEVRRLRLEIPGSPISADWSPDGRKIAFAVDTGHSQSIWVADATGENARELYHCAGSCLAADYPAWSPNGKTIAFTYYNAKPRTSGPPSGDSIRVIDVAAREVRVVIRSKLPSLVDLARWSPDGRQLVIERDRFSSAGDETGCRIEIVRVSNGRARPVISYSRFGFHPDWSSKGDLLTFATYDLAAFRDSAPGASNLFTIRPDGTHSRQLTHFKRGGNRVSAPTFTPDGSQIVFTYEAGTRRAGFIAIGGGVINTVAARHAGPVTHPRLTPNR